MAELRDRLRTIFSQASSRVTPTSTYIRFEPSMVKSTLNFDEEFREDQHYFQIVINEMFLANNRKWFTEYDPIVFATTRFAYNGREQEVPQVIGTNFLSKYRRDMPQGTRFVNTPASGFHPFVGGEFVIGLVLYRAELENYLRNLLGIVEKLIALVNPSVALGSYLNIAGVVIDGLEVIIGSGSRAEPLVAVHQSFLMGGEQKLKPGYFALVNAPETEIDPQRLWVQGDRLCVGDSLTTSVPYTAHDFILFSINQTDTRNDIQILPFYSTWRDVQRAAAEAQEERDWDRAKLKFKSLAEEILFSPDLTSPQKDKLIDEFQRVLENLRERFRQLGDMGIAVTRTDKEYESVSTKLEDLNNWIDKL